MATEEVVRARAKLIRWRDDPVSFVRENFHAEPDAWQIRALEAFASGDPAKKRISLQACAGPGKTGCLAWIGWNFLACHASMGEHPKGAVVAVTKDNLKDNLWPEFSKWQQRSDYLKAAFTWQKERIFANDHAETWFLSARSWSKTANAEEQGRTLSGLHSQHVLALCDESGEIPVAVLKTGEQALSNCTFGKIVQAGNPTSQDGMLYAAASTLRHLWHVIRITGDPDDPERSPRIDLEWAKAQVATYGRDNPWVQAYILGQFPPGSLNALLGVEEVEAAMGRHLEAHVFNWAQKRLGVDVARFGTDRSVIFPRQGLAAFRPIVMRIQRTTDIAARVAMAVEKWGAETITVDDTGHWGHGVIDNLVAAGHNPIGIQFHGAALDPRYRNRRAEMWIKMSEWVKGGGALPDMPELVGELTTPTYTFVNGKFLLEDKDQVKARLGRSPDLADSLALTFAMPEMPAGMMKKSTRAIIDFDPYRDDSEPRPEFDPYRETI